MYFQKNLPAGVVPLPRDPKQDAHVGKRPGEEAYEGICRSSRFGDTWKSQITFGGAAHHLGTFDSEWDAAAIHGKINWFHSYASF